MATHKDLDVWKESIDLVEVIYKLTAKLPKEEVYNLTSQMRRASVSISSNIAEGAARSSSKDYVRFLYMSLGSVSELETQCLIVERIFQMDISEAISKVERQRNKLIALIRYLKSRG
jgi:four helix bundle protein